MTMVLQDRTLPGSVVVLLVAALAAYFVYSRIRRTQSRIQLQGFTDCKEPPAYRHKDFLFGLDSLYASIQAGKVHKSLEREQALHDIYGTTFSSQFLGSTILNTIDPDNLQTVLSTDFEHFGVGSRRKTAFRPLLGDGIFQRDGPGWQASRTLLRPCFSRLTTAAIEKVENHVQDLIQVISGETSVVDLGPLFERLAADVAIDLIFGEAVNSFSDPTVLEANVMSAIHNSQSACELRWLLGPLADLAPQPAFDKNVRTVHAYVESQIQKALHKSGPTSFADDSSSGHQSGSFLDHLSVSIKDPQRLLDEVLTVFFAGADPVGALWTNLFFELAKRPDVWRRIGDEVRFLKGDPPSINQLKALQLTNWCISESLRLNPPQASNSRVAEQDTILPRGGGKDGLYPVFVPKGRLVHFSTYSLHRSKQLWGDDADRFNPDRWSNESQTWKFIPFLRGTRTCLGHFALLEAAYVLVRLVQRFPYIKSANQGPWEERLLLACTSKDGAKVFLSNQA